MDRSGHAERRRKEDDGSLTSFFKRLGFREDLLPPFRVLQSNARGGGFFFLGKDDLSF